MQEYTKFRNKNRGYMKLEAWHKAIELFKLIMSTFNFYTRDWHRYQRH
jgi:hypothetical protein